MKLTIEMNIKSILFGVEENVIGNLNIGNDYEVIKDSLTNEMLWKEFDYTTFGLRRIYETAKLNDELDVAVLKKVKL